ncbi:MAG: cupin domain-containing protein [Halobacteriota archaeon]
MSSVNQSDLDWTEIQRGETRFRRKRLARAAGGDQLGCSLYELPAGARSWPFHYHTGNEEALYVLSGTGRLRLSDETRTLREGDYVALPTAPESAHQVVNDGDEPLRYLAVSTMNHPDVTVYPDSEKFGVFAGSPPGGDAERVVHGYFREDDAVDYWDGETESDTDE